MVKKKRKRKKFPYSGYNMASKSETVFAEWCDEMGIQWIYEPEKFNWYPPQPKIRKYTPDFKIINRKGKIFFVEFKGWLRPADKTKMKAVKHQRPDLDIRFVFAKGDKPVVGAKPRKNGTKMTHAEWAEKYGYKWAEGTIPDAWLEEEI